MIKKNKFKKNKTIENKIKKYFGFPYKKNPSKKILDNLEKSYYEKIKNFKFIKHNSLIENLFGYGIFLFLSEIKIYFDPYNKDSFFSKKTKTMFFLPRKIYNYFNKYLNNR